MPVNAISLGMVNPGLVAYTPPIVHHSVRIRPYQFRAVLFRYVELGLPRIDGPFNKFRD